LPRSARLCGVPESSTSLATVVFTDIVASTEVAAELGDRRWRELVRRHHALVRRELRRYGGREIDTAGDGFFATFDRPAAGIHAACAITDALRELGIEIRAGVHVGEVEGRGQKVGGMAVNIGARVMALAGAGEVLVTSTAKELVPGAGFGFEDREAQQLKGVPGTWTVFAVTSVNGRGRPAPPSALVARERREAVQPPTGGRRRPWLVGGIAAVVAIAVVAAVLALVDDPGPPPSSTKARGIAPGTAVQVDPETGEVLASVPGLPSTSGPEPGPIAVGEGGVWVYIFPQLVHVDPIHHSIEEIIPMGFATTVAVGFNEVWLASTRAKGITRIDPADNTKRSAIDLPFPDRPTSASDNATGLAVGEGSVWETWGSGHLVRVDPRKGRAESIDLGTNLYGVAAGEGSVWVGDQINGSIISVDPDTGEAAEPIDFFGNIDGLAVGEGQVWILDKGASTVTPIPVSARQPGGAIDVGESPTDMEAGLGAVWVSDESGTITRIDAVNHQSTEFDLGTPIASIAVDPESETVWALAAVHQTFA
jgi:class 3 adenylate cyclase/streptogramin lyase